MIENEGEYKFTRYRASRFRKTLIALYNLQADEYKALRNAEIDGIESQLDDLNQQIKEWEAKLAK